MIHLGGIDLNLLPVFEAVYRHRNLTRAGENLGLTQSAVSHALGRLRKLFGDALFVRTKGEMAPTPRAVAIYASLEPSLAGIRTLLKEPAPFDPATAKKNIRLSMSDYCEMVILPPLMHHLSREAPGIRIEISPMPSDKTQVGLESGEFELAVGHREVGPGIFRRHLFDDDFQCMVHNSHPAIGETLSLEDYLVLPHAIFSPRAKGDVIIEKTLSQMGYQRNVALRVPHILIIPKILETTGMIVTLPRRLAYAFENIAAFRLFAPPMELPSLSIMLYWHERMNGDPANRWLRKTIAELPLGLTKEPDCR
ncbi:MAG: LysR family transcriptional regulator [Desulfobacterium sp.]|nr:LysR family transcriptional regulator [Desulfobacterium sp.]